MVCGRPQTARSEESKAKKEDSLLIQIVNSQIVNHKKISLGIAITNTVIGTGLLIAKSLGVNMFEHDFGEKWGNIVDYAVMGLNYFSATINYLAYRGKRHH